MSEPERDYELERELKAFRVPPEPWICECGQKAVWTDPSGKKYCQRHLPLAARGGT